jgi:hypothetical protein
MSFRNLKISTIAAALAVGLAAPAFADDERSPSVNPSEQVPNASINEQTGVTNNSGDSMIAPWLFGGETGSVQAPQNTNPSEDDPTATAIENTR